MKVDFDWKNATNDPIPEDKFIHFHDNEDSVFQKLWDSSIAYNSGIIDDELMDYWEEMESTKEQRLIPLISALCIEKALDKLLESFLIDYKKNFLKDKDITFSMKIKIFRSIGFLPKRLLDSSELIKNIRNKFAHNLELKKIEDINKLKNKIKPKLSLFINDNLDNEKYLKNFKHLTQLTLLGLTMYRFQISDLREFLESKAFENSFRTFLKIKKATKNIESPKKNQN